jgi:hypothetical protein
VLAGVGGRTVAEAKERLTFDEAIAWQAYLEKRGSANLGMRLEYGFALIARSINHALGGNATLRDFMPHADQPNSLAEVMKILSGRG